MIDFQEKYIEDAGELIMNLETQLFGLEEHPDDMILIKEIFRVMHTLKGSASMFGFEMISNITHHLETVYDYIREGQLPVTPDIVDLTFHAVDIIKALLFSKESIDAQSRKQYDFLLAKVKVISEIESKKLGIVIDESEGGLEMFNEQPSANQNNTTEYYYILFNPKDDIYIRGIKPQNVFEELETLGKYTAKPCLDKIPQLAEIEPNKNYIFWEIYVRSTSSLNDISEVFLFFYDVEYKVVAVDVNNLELSTGFQEIYLEANSKRTDFSEAIEVFSNFADKQEIAPEIMVEIDSKAPTPPAPERPQETPDSKKKSDDSEKKFTSIRVSSEKLDELINLVSELVTINSQLGIHSDRIHDEKLTKSIKSLEKLSKRFRDNALGLRLVPINILMVNFQRLVRDLAHKLNKDIEFVAEGGDTELDKNIINNLEIPLMHIIRNSIDHGIEDAEDRERKGKTKRGIIRFIAFYSGANVFIQVQDDGKGIDTEFIKRKAIDKGLISSTSQLNKKEIYELIFTPGFSTAQCLTEVSGRGVGMDVVRKHITELRGEIEIDSEVDLGTSVTLKLPLTLSIIDTLMVLVDNRPFLIPLSVIESCRKTFSEELYASENRHIEYENELIPIIHLREDFGVQRLHNTKEKIVVIKQHDKRYAFVVDTVMGEHQAVIKPLGHLHKKQDFLSGASILGDGSLALIIDTNKLIKGKIESNSL